MSTPELSEGGILVPEGTLPKSVKTWRCAKGHQYNASRPMKLVMSEEGATIMETGPLCPMCFQQWADREFGTKEVDPKARPRPNRAQRRAGGNRHVGIRRG